MNEKMTYEDFCMEAVQHLIVHCHLEENPERMKLYMNGFQADDPETERFVQATNEKYGHAGADHLVGDYIVLFSSEKKGGSVFSRFEVKYLYSEFLRGGWERVEQIVDENTSKGEAIKPDFFSTLDQYDQVKDKLILCLRNGSDSSIRKNYVFQRFCDIVIVLYIIAADFGDGNRMISKVPRNSFKQWKIAEDEVFLAALQNTARCSPPRIVYGMEEFLSGHVKGEEFMNPLKPMRKLPRDSFGATVTAYPTTDGAAAIFYPGVMKRLSEMADGSYYVVFTGKDEAHIHAEGTVPIQRLNEVLYDSNREFPQDALTRHVYFYDAMQKKLRRI